MFAITTHANYLSADMRLATLEVGVNTEVATNDASVQQQVCHNNSNEFLQDSTVEETQQDERMDEGTDEGMDSAEIEPRRTSPRKQPMEETKEETQSETQSEIAASPPPKKSLGPWRGGRQRKPK